MRLREFDLDQTRRQVEQITANCAKLTASLGSSKSTQVRGGGEGGLILISWLMRLNGRLARISHRIVTYSFRHLNIEFLGRRKVKGRGVDAHHDPRWLLEGEATLPSPEK